MSTSPAYDKISLLRLAFKGLDDSELDEIAALTELRTYPPGHVLCREGACEDIFYIVADGGVAVTKRIGEEEGERLLRLGGRGDLVGEMALIQNAPRSATVRTTTECTVLEMEKRDFETLLSCSPRMAIAIIGITLDRLRANDRTAIEELQKSNKVLRQLDRNKQEFIQVAAHELRTPLTVIKGYVSVLQGAADIRSSPDLAKVVEGIAQGAERMHAIVNMMLDVTRIDNERVRIASVPLPVKRLVNDLVQDVRKLSASRQVEITARHAEEMLDIFADPSMVQKALYQLLINAVKYTPDGGRVEVSTRPAVMDNGLPGVEIAVHDTGIGLDAEHHELVFEKFYQVGNVALHSSGKTVFKGGGPGLGLAIVRGVARAHGGKAWVESPGHDEVNFPGSTFYLQLPVNAPPGWTPAPASS
jgi:signal transduction histidine kinase